MFYLYLINNHLPAYFSNYAFLSANYFSSVTWLLNMYIPTFCLPIDEPNKEYIKAYTALSLAKHYNILCMRIQQIVHCLVHMLQSWLLLGSVLPFILTICFLLIILIVKPASFSLLYCRVDALTQSGCTTNLLLIAQFTSLVQEDFATWVSLSHI